MSVAVVIAAYNAERSIERAIGSVLRQTRAATEIVVVDDASTDNTLAIVNSLSGGAKQIRTISLPLNSGPSAARNAAINSTNADWIAILDADDAWKPERLERLMAVAEKERPDMVADNFVYFDAVAEVESGFGFDPSSAPRFISLEDVISSDIIGRSSFSLALLQPIIRRKFLVSNRILYNEETRLAEDTRFLIDCLVAGAKVLVLPGPYYIYSTPVGGISGVPSPTRKTKIRYDVMAADNLMLENKYAGRISKRAMALLKKRRRQLMARHHSAKSSELKRDGKLFGYAVQHIRHAGVIGLKLTLLQEFLTSWFQSGPY